jgi:RND family efflux transporter MFP subunit
MKMIFIQCVTFWKRVLLTMAFISLFSHCSDKNQYIEPPPPTVTVAQPKIKSVTDYLEFTGTTEAVEYVEIRARVSGFLQSMHFEPGTLVQAGDLLFVIDPKPYAAELAAADADLKAARAELKRAEVELKRANQLVKKKFISATDHLRRVTERDTASAAIARFEAKVQSARLKLGYTRVTSPITGRASRNIVDIGNLVGESEATLLTTVTKFKPMYAYFHLNERDLLRVMEVHRKALKEKGLDADYDRSSQAEIPVFLGLATDSDYPHQGILDFAESNVNTDTGTIELRAVFPNADKPPRLLPGLFAQIRFPVGEHAEAMLVNEQAIGSDQRGSYLLTVNQDNIVEKKPIKAAQIIDGMRVITQGIKAGDKIIINGIQKARPGSKVNPQTVSEQSKSAASKKKATANSPQG